jgi:outer membrane lipoprotein-sorting protein
MMRYRYTAILAVFLILIAMTVAGCTTTTTTPAATAGASKAPTATAKATDTTGGSGMLSSIYQMGKFNWYEYMMKSSFGDFNVKSEYSTASYGGVPNARYLKYTMVMGKGTAQEITTVNDLYYDGTKFLGGHTKMTSGGQVMSDQDIAAGDSTYGNLDTASQTASGGSNVAIVNAGAETVTVPAGTYACTKYTASDSSYRGTYWVAANVPVPVKMSMTDSKGEVTGSMELVGWG